MASKIIKRESIEDFKNDEGLWSGGKTVDSIRYITRSSRLWSNVNTILISCKAARGEYSVGVNLHKPTGKFIDIVTGKQIGRAHV